MTTAISADDAITEAAKAIDNAAATLLEVSHRIHDCPELGFAEYEAVDLLTGVLDEAGFLVRRGMGGLDTAFVGEMGTSGPVVVVCCEYDALPSIGHGCGHNVIAAAGLGAALGAAQVAADLGGRIRIVGAPAEEVGGGKIALIEAGIFDGVDAAVMVHPGGMEQTYMPSLARAHLIARYQGKAAHAAAAPDAGRNALDAAVLGYLGVATLRQHIRDDERIHGIFTKSGDLANIVPETAEAEWFVRAPTAAMLEALVERVTVCLEAGAASAGCDVEVVSEGPMYAEIIDNQTILARYIHHARAAGRDPRPPGGSVVVAGSSDFGNLSQLVPAIHPVVKIAPEVVAIHTREFAEHASGAAADAAILDASKILAATVIDIWCTDGLLDAAVSELADARGALG